MWPYWLIICTVCSVAVSTMLLKHQLIFYLLQEVVFLSFFFFLGGGSAALPCLSFKHHFFEVRPPLLSVSHSPFFLCVVANSSCLEYDVHSEEEEEEMHSSDEEDNSSTCSKEHLDEADRQVLQFNRSLEGVVTLKLRCLRWWLIISVLLKAGDSAGKSWIPVYGAGLFLWTSVCGHPRRNSLLCFLNESSDLLA